MNNKYAADKFIGIVLFLLSFFCSCNNSISKDSFIGSYILTKTIPPNASGDWVLRLEEKNNFHLSGPEKEIDGYWRMEADGNQLLFQAEGTTATATFNGKEIYFEHATPLINNLFSKATFVRQND